jgi:hypothetical protein
VCCTTHKICTDCTFFSASLTALPAFLPACMFVVCRHNICTPALAVSWSVRCTTHKICTQCMFFSTSLTALLPSFLPACLLSAAATYAHLSLQ